MPRCSASACSARYSSERCTDTPTVPLLPVGRSPRRRPLPLRNPITGVGKPTSRTTCSAPIARSASRPLTWTPSHAPTSPAGAGGASWTVAPMPAFCSAMAATGPATPPPTTSALIASPGPASSPPPEGVGCIPPHPATRCPPPAARRAEVRARPSTERSGVLADHLLGAAGLHPHRLAGHLRGADLLSDVPGDESAGHVGAEP